MAPIISQNKTVKGSLSETLCTAGPTPSGKPVATTGCDHLADFHTELVIAPASH